MAISDLHSRDDSDLALIRRTRTGDNDAFGLLHRRHIGAARALAWRMSRSASDADDLVSEGFARVLSALQRGGGPDTAFRPYLLSTIRRLAYDRTHREQREAPLGHEVEVGTVTDDPVLAGFERDTAAAAFASLPERWRMVLWHTEVEGESPAEVAALLGMNPNAVAALAYRAREGLRQAYLSRHAGAEHVLSQECRPTTDRLAAYVRGALPPAQEQRVTVHLDECDRCRAAHLELCSVNTSMRSVLAPIVLGPLAGAAYLAELAHPTASITGPPGRAAVRGLRRVVGTPARRAVTAGVAVAVATSVGLIAARGDPGQEAAVRPHLAAPLVSTEAPGPARSAFTTTTGIAATIGSPAGSEIGAGSDSDADVAASPHPGIASPERWASTSAFPGRVVPGGPGPSAPDPFPGLGPPDPATPTPGLVSTTTTTTTPTTTPASTPTATTPTTTPIAATPTTPATTPPAPAHLQLSLSSAGHVVAGRPGVLVAAVSNVGEGDGHGVRLQLDLNGLVLRGLPRASEAAGTPAAPTWACGSAGAFTLTCTTDAMAGGAVSSIYVPVVAPAEAQQAEVSGVVTGSTDAVDAGATTHLALAVRPTGMAARFAALERGEVVAAGNTLVSCPEGSPGCIEARQGQGPALDNGGHAMVAVDTDADSTTANSSSAVSTCAGDAVLSASLYWGAELVPGLGGHAPGDPSSVGRAVVVTPGGQRAEVAAERVDVVGSRYQAVAEVTDLVAGGGAGSWTVGGVQIATGEGTFGGWSLVVACADASSPLRSLVVLDGLTEVRSGSSVTLEVGGFTVPAAGSGAASITAVTYEGDLGLEGDQLQVAGQAVADAGNPVGNTFNSTASRLGIPAAGSVPGDRNLFGFDVDRFDLAGVLPAGVLFTVLELSTTDDVYLPGVVAFAVDQ